MLAKILIGTGAFAIFASVLGIVWGILASFRSLKFNESAGIGAVGGGLQLALVSNILLFAGLFLLVVGVIKFYRDKRLGK